MDTPLRLIGLKRQMAFVGEIKDERLKGILVFPKPLVIKAVVKILVNDYIMREDHTRDNSDIATMLLAVAMHCENDRNVAMKLCKKVFKKKLLLELDRVVVNIDEELYTPKPHHYDILIRMNNRVPRYPILSIKDPIAFEAYKWCRRT